MVTTSWWVLVSWQQEQLHCLACASMEYLQMHNLQDLPSCPDCPAPGLSGVRRQWLAP